jgi:hypothetical protein
MPFSRTLPMVIESLMLSASLCYSYAVETSHRVRWIDQTDLKQVLTFEAIPKRAPELATRKIRGIPSSRASFEEAKNRSSTSQPNEPLKRLISFVIKITLRPVGNSGVNRVRCQATIKISFNPGGRFGGTNIGSPPAPLSSPSTSSMQCIRVTGTLRCLRPPRRRSSEYWRQRD